MREDRSAPGDDSFAACRAALIREVADEVRSIGPELGIRGLSARVLDAMASVPRHEFVPAEYRELAYRNVPLPIGRGQTISQPSMVAIMTELAQPRSDGAVLEVGTGCGYQAAVLAVLTDRVYTIEVIPELAEAARKRLEQLGYANVHVRVGDGSSGWPEYAPYPSILVTAAPREIPAALVDQLAPGGRLVIPVGDPFLGQELRILEKGADGRVVERRTLPVAFVPLTHGGSSDAAIPALEAHRLGSKGD